MSKRVGIVVPTLGKRLDYLNECLESIKQAGDAHVCIVSPKDFDAEPFLARGLAHQLVLDPGSGLAEAINVGIRELPSEIEYINWLGDDDLLAPDSLIEAAKLLDSEPNTVLVYGSCDYVDPNGKVFWTNKSGRWAIPLLHFGPDLIPQPGALIRRKVFEQLGGLNKTYAWAFDFDLFLRLKKIGRLRFVKKTLASFRWHQESLSVEYRSMSVSEASKVRVSHLPGALRPISFIWEFIVRKATLAAGNRVTKKAKRVTN